MAIHSKDLPGITRLKNKQQQQFFSTQDSSKQYHYHSIHPQLDSEALGLMSSQIKKGFSVAMIWVAQSQSKHSLPIASEIGRMVGEAVCFGVELSEEGITDMLIGKRVTEKECEHDKKYYQIPKTELSNILDKLIKNNSKTIRIVRMRRKIDKEVEGNTITLIVLP